MTRSNRRYARATVLGSCIVAILASAAAAAQEQTGSQPAASETPTELTDTIILGQGQRGILELRYKHPGNYLFHAHKTEFAELGWVGQFEVTA